MLSNSEHRAGGRRTKRPTWPRRTNRRRNPVPLALPSHQHHWLCASAFPFQPASRCLCPCGRVPFLYNHRQGPAFPSLLYQLLVRCHGRRISGATAALPLPSSLFPFASCSALPPSPPMAHPRGGVCPLLSLAVSLALLCGGADAALRELEVGYYARTCPGAEEIVRGVMARALSREPRSVASVMRLQFHDCFVNGCDGSVLMDATPTVPGEKEALSNINSLRSFEVVDQVKEALEEHCPGVVSCADIIVMASRDAVVLTGGPRWDVRLGREDSLTASQEDSDNIMPSPRANASTLIRLFAGYNLTITDLVALSGSHSIAYRAKLDALCPLGGDEEVTGGMDATPIVFDNQYFKDLVHLRGFLNSDQTLFSDNAGTRQVVAKFSEDQDAFFRAFADGMVKMGELQNPRKGEIRRNCRVANGSPSPRHKQVLLVQSLVQDY
ncbi:hypothetical protein BRADI_4g32810v3 [Brachypodium distachyon]|uniref:peroxidase n=1 Tax=Brachypodium distachyon TaxID=15368 RepID=A0A2K2CRW7_BRADI|nr:hypothetical protein BRADI_4g32810v3 [Brachypodium distachyon]